MVISPCVGICILDPVTGYCRGCHRTLDEIANWADYSEAEAREVLALLPDRDPLAAEAD